MCLASRNVYILNSGCFGNLLIELLASQFPVNGVIGLSDNGERAHISGFAESRDVAAKNGLQFTEVEDYRLADDADRERLSALQIDLLIVGSWQRLVPEWLIEQVSVGVVGVHGSAEGITAGRGRSPQNWALISRADQFHVSIFWIKRGIDDGPLIETRTFEYDDTDDIVSSYCKTVLATADMVGNLLAQKDVPAGIAQDEQLAGYLPMRTEEDGAIDWRRSAANICAFVRALTRPYPGAFTTLNGKKVHVWRARPMAIMMELTTILPGQVVAVLDNGHFLVRAGDGLVLIDDSDCSNASLAVGAVFEQTDFVEQLDAIASRHIERYPDQPLSPLFLRLRESASMEVVR